MQLAVVVLWSKALTNQLVVEWHTSQASTVGTWVGPLPVAITPSWQLSQLPMTWA